MTSVRWSRIGPVVVHACLMWALTFDVQAQNLEIDWDTLHSQGVIVEFVTSAEGKPGIRTYFVVNASRDRIWKSLVDYDNFQNIFEGIDKIAVTDCSELGARVQY